MRVYSDLSHDYYDFEDTVKIKNTLQAGKYIKHGLNPLDIFWDDDVNTLVFVFDKEASKPLYQRWKAYDLE